jgi:anthranilate synthase component 1
MNPEQFAALATQGFNRIPLVRELVADLETPVSCYLKLASKPYSFLLESVHGGETWGRYSIIGLPCNTVVSISGSRIQVFEHGQQVEQREQADPLVFVEQFRARFRVPEIENLPTFHGGLVGYFGYDTVRFVEPRLCNIPAQDPLQTPDIALMLADELVVFDNLSGTLKIIVHCDPAETDAYNKGIARLDAISAQLSQPAPASNSLQLDSAADKGYQDEEFHSEFDKDDYLQAVERIKDYILAGDAMQVVLAQRLSVPFEQDAFDLYRALRLLNPSPYLYFLDFSDFHIVGSSPEILARAEAGTVTVRPIAGTRPRGRDEAHDKALAEELLADPKERAEHLMLIDLGRNDAGRISKTGTVELVENMIIERYSHVMHIVSKVQSELRDDLNSLDVLRATLPAGTLSGAPKVRAMEIIDELEPSKRGIYGGAVGYLSWQGDMDTAIAIRTAVVKDKTLYIQAGAGVVADSVPEMEWQECVNKARAILRAAALAQRSSQTK